ncbi:hypothetical protein FACS189465_1330 [Clostridia bacterium]|nr:hypothetical protein FACS189465_1330 [Clostridia bacterium]
MPNDSKYEEYSPIANKFINPDGTIRTLAEIIGGVPVGGVSEARPFVSNYDYVQYEIIQNSGVLYAALVDFTSGVSFVATDWRELSGGSGSSVSKAQPFQPNYAYAQYEIIQNGGKLYAAIADFTSTAAFVVTDWQLIEDPDNVKISDFVSAITPTNKGVTQTEISSLIPDAPSDAKLYGRKDATWSEVSAGLPDAPLDAKLYGRKDAAWEEIVSNSVSMAKPFQSNTEYKQFEIIQYNNKLYSALADFTSSVAFVAADRGLIEDINNVKITDFVTNISSTNKGITQTEFAEKENVLTAGTNISIDRTVPTAPVLNVPNLSVSGTLTTGAISPTQYNALALM